MDASETSSVPQQGSFEREPTGIDVVRASALARSTEVYTGVLGFRVSEICGG
jgi:hypothetical protein